MLSAKRRMTPIRNEFHSYHSIPEFSLTNFRFFVLFTPILFTFIMVDYTETVFEV